ncbi:U6 snRNA phosphodiesterase [Aricia agestis]|uniref:U6 snRNA phosphodiesterase n=1 Tax=Aricia agestis TaxID=91739 RepID=UPI001C201C75|nr:U6 snRNA phosphodiesterase [Aricia agestis]
MSGLSLICDYGESDGSEENENDDLETFKSVGFRTKLPAPDLSKVSVIKTEEHIDNPDQHGGKIRSFSHVRGNWATFVFIKYPDLESLNIITENFANQIESIGLECKKCDDFHISLSKTFVLKYHLIAPLTESLQEVFNTCDSFELGFHSIAIYCNEEETRTFVALKADIYSSRGLLMITQKIDNILVEYKLPQFYDDPSFHMSILYVNGNKKNELTKILERLNGVFVKYEKNIGSVIINKIECKSGNKYFQYYLQ